MFWILEISGTILMVIGGMVLYDPMYWYDKKPWFAVCLALMVGIGAGLVFGGIASTL